MSAAGYELLDFGAGRKLERFGEVVVDRPSPAAEGYAPHNPSAWRQTHGRFERTAGINGQWRWTEPPPAPWLFRPAELDLTLELRPTDFGHIGVFPEQADNWAWIAERVKQVGPGCRVLNVFAYTGGSTLTAARAGAEVTHVDAARTVVAWARRNAEASGLSAAPIRWLCEDARKYALRQSRRGQTYHGIVLDPPSYGHGPSGQAWKLEAHLPELLAACRDLLDPAGGFLLLTCHSPGYDAAQLKRLLIDLDLGAKIESAPLQLIDAAGRPLDCGAMARVL